MSKLKKLHVLNHTHWDREWYETFEQFRYKLRNGLRYVQQMLDEGKIDNFFIDGQTIVLDDYREVVSKEEYEKLTNYIREGKIEVGPWYLLADEFLVGGESLLKNLEIGTEMAKELGSPCNIGYLPDTFGHISQMPQILRNNNINFSIVWRGAVSNRFENNWVGADGSSVFTFVLPLFEGYYQTFLKHDTYEQEVQAYMDGNAPYLQEGTALLMNGADHTFTNDDLRERLETVKENNPTVEIVQSLMSHFTDDFQGVTAERDIHGEQRDPSKIFILPGVYSTRMYLKEQNARCEDRAIHTMEALNVWTNGETNSDAFMKYVWKKILENHPHDSICGCSVDEVHDEMETRSQKVLSAIQQFERDTLNEMYPFHYLDEKVENHQFNVMNNLPFAKERTVQTTIMIPQSQDRGGIRLYDNGQEIEFDVIHREEREEFLRHIKAEPHYGLYVVYDVQFTLPFRGVETKCVCIELCETTTTIKLEQTNTIENELYRITTTENGLRIENKQTGDVHDGQNTFVSSLDAGDTYNYSPPVHDVWNEAKVTEVRDVVIGDTFQQMTVCYELTQPKQLCEDRTCGSSELVTSSIESVVTLVKGKEQIVFKTKVANEASDQKLRIGFQTVKTPHSFADTAFDVLQRETLREKQFDMERNKEAVYNQYPTSSMVYNDTHQIVHRGLQEYEIDTWNGNDHIFMTMLRSVGWLSRRDLRARGNGAGPGFATPGAQCLGTYEFEYAVTMDRTKGNINEAKELRAAVLTQQSYVKNQGVFLFSQSNEEIAFSSFQQKERDSFHIRMFNPSMEEKTTMLELGFNPSAVYEVNTLGEIIAPVRPSEKIEVTFQGKQIKTIRVEK